MIVRICKSLIEPRELLIPSSKKDGTYYRVVSSSLLNDAVCDCPGFLYRGSCRHINECALSACPLKLYPHERIKCLDCGEYLVDFEIDPEFD